MFTATFLIREQTHDDFIDDLGACRTASNTLLPTHPTSGGLLAFYTMSGTCLMLDEIVHRETQTVILLRFLSMLRYGAACDFVPFFNRMAGFGFDVCCGLWKRVITMATSGLLTKLQMWFYFQALPYFFVDKMHITAHTNPT